MLEILKEREKRGRRIRVGLVGAGAMGRGIALQVGMTPGMELGFVADIDEAAAHSAVEAARSVTVPVEAAASERGKIAVGTDAHAFLQSIAIDVLVESTNTIGPAAEYCLAAFENNAHAVLMNAEVDLALGPLLEKSARRNGVFMTSDAGDQHGVIKTMIDEIALWGFDIVQGGNIKGFLNRHATAGMLLEEAAKRHLNAVQCCAYTDGTKLNIEMACLANGTGLIPFRTGMEGPACKDVREVLSLFDFDAYGGEGRVDYVLGAEPGGGVYVVGRCDNPLQAQYLEYYKMGPGPYYLFYRPYHLCHLETTRAVAELVLRQHPVMTPSFGRVADVYAYAKKDLAAGTVVDHGIGGDAAYGLIEERAPAESAEKVPIALLEGEDGKLPRITRDVKKDAPLTGEDVELPDTTLHRRFAEQAAMSD